MTEAVGDHSVPVDADEDDGDPGAVLVGSVQGLGDPVLQHVLVGQAGKRVEYGKSLQRPFGSLAVADVPPSVGPRARSAPKQFRASSDGRQREQNDDDDERHGLDGRAGAPAAPGKVSVAVANRTVGPLTSRTAAFQGPSGNCLLSTAAASSDRPGASDELRVTG